MNQHDQNNQSTGQSYSNHSDSKLDSDQGTHKTIVYDVPTRAFHWIFAVLFVIAFIIGKTVDDESIVFTYHMLLGLTLGFTILMRLLWGVVGSKHAKWSSFSLNLKDLIDYLKGVIFSDAKSVKKYYGHNPASSWAAVIMIACGLGLTITGLLMISGQKEAFEDIHELFSTIFVLVAIAHVVGVIVHSVKHKEMIGLSMISGKKDGHSESEGITNSHAILGVVFVILVAAFGGNLVKNFDTSTGQLNFFGKILQLTENEEGDKADNNETTKNKEDTGDNKSDDNTNNKAIDRDHDKDDND